MKSVRSKFLQDLLLTLDASLASEGFRRKKSTYVKKSDYYLYFVNWQISNDDLPGKIKFTINIGVHDLTLAKILEADAFPDVWDCHLNERIGFLMPEQDDKWWIVEVISPVSDHLSDEMLSVVKKYVLPYFSKFSKSEDLREMWATGIAPGQTDRQRLYFIELLAKKDLNACKS